MNFQKLNDVFRISALPVVLASLCCLSPIILVLFGLGTVSFASTLATTLYGGYKWYFRAAGLFAIAMSLVLYFRRTKGICTMDAARRHRNEILNTVVLSLCAGVLGYLFFLYVVVHYIGVFLKLWT